MVDRETVEKVRAALNGLKAIALEQDEQMLCYLIEVAEREAEDVLSGRFQRGIHPEEFAPTLQ